MEPRAGGVRLSTGQRALLERFAGLVAASPHNLVSRRARGELWDRHIPECLALADLLPRAQPTGRRTALLDVGSGGGFPGLVLAIARPELAVTLVEATQKKAAFLTATAHELDLDVRVVNQRAEALVGGELAGSFELVTARALAPLERLIGWTVPFLTPSGLLYALKGERWEQELRAAAGALRRAGAQVVATPEDVSPGRVGGNGEATPRVVIIGRTP